MLHESQQDSLRWQLKMLHQLLEEIGAVDTSTKEAMQVVAADLKRVLDNKEAEQPEDENWPQLGKRWQEAVLEFESQHPRLAQAVDEISSILANAGI